MDDLKDDIQYLLDSLFDDELSRFDRIIERLEGYDLAYKVILRRNKEMEIAHEAILKNNRRLRNGVELYEKALMQIVGISDANPLREAEMMADIARKALELSQ